MPLRPSMRPSSRWMARRRRRTWKELIIQPRAGG
jgi:hypothetical protein